MKDLSTEHIAIEEADQRLPVELYHIWYEGGQNWYYTSCDVTISFDGNDYEPSPIKRGSVRFNSELEAQTMKFTTSYLNGNTSEFITTNPIQPLWISVVKTFHDRVTDEGEVVFIGQIKTVSFKGVQAEATCVGFEHYLKKIIPLWRYQINCNHTVFDTNCALTKSSYLTSAVVDVSWDGQHLTSTSFGSQASGYFIGGEVVYGSESRTIIDHSGNIVRLMYKFKTLETGETVLAYPGCDGRPETCRDKYDNILNFLGFPFIPEENPALRVQW